MVLDLLPSLAEAWFRVQGLTVTGILWDCGVSRAYWVEGFLGLGLKGSGCSIEVKGRSNGFRSKRMGPQGRLRIHGGKNEGIIVICLVYQACIFSETCIFCAALRVVSGRTAACS